MSQQLEGRLAIITGAGGGIGREICREYIREGARVAAVDIHEDNLEETLKQCGSGINPFKADISKSAEVAQLIKDVISGMGETPQILVNCAGLPGDSSLLDMKEEVFDQLMNVNLKGVFLMTQQVAKTMITNSVQHGSIVNISSIAARKPFPNLSHYCASKAAVVSFTRCTALELVEHGIRCNAICPGIVRTPMLEKGPREVVETNTAAVPMKRLAEPKEIADGCVFLASAKSKYITGEEILIDGGFLLT